MELTGDLKKKAAAAESRDEAGAAIADAALTEDELNAVSGGARLRYSVRRKPEGGIKTFRVTNSAGAPIWDQADPRVRSQIGFYPFGAEFLANPNARIGFVNPTITVFYYRVEAQDGYPEGLVLTADATQA